MLGRPASPPGVPPKLICPRCQDKNVPDSAGTTTLLMHQLALSGAFGCHKISALSKRLPPKVCVCEEGRALPNARDVTKICVHLELNCA